MLHSYQPARILLDLLERAVKLPIFSSSGDREFFVLLDRGRVGAFVRVEGKEEDDDQEDGDEEELQRVAV